MPTGYTANIYEGKFEAFEDFILHISRGFGAFVMQRDDPSSDKPKMRMISSYTVDSLARDTEALRKWRGMSDDAKHDLWRDYADEAEASERRSERTRTERLARYEARLAEVKAWDVPEEIEPIKKFAIEQIEQSIDFDCKKYERTIQGFDEWVDSHDAYLVRSAEYAKESYDKEVQRVAEQNKFTALLYNSLGLTYKE